MNDKAKVYELTGVSEERLRDVSENFKAEGAAVTEVFREKDGTWTVRATFAEDTLDQTG